MFERKDDTGKMVGVALVAAAASAAAVYYLFGTESGARNRSKAKKVADTLREHATDIKEDLKESWADAKDSLKDEKTKGR